METWLDRLFPIHVASGLYVANWRWGFDPCGNWAPVPAIRIICTWFGG